MPAALLISGPCKICDLPAHGNHFGVLSCRACAAFFRRASRSPRFQDKACEYGDCRIFDAGAYRCKICRLKKCYKVGMDASKFQKDRDLISSSNAYLKRTKVYAPQSLANFLGRPEFIISFEPEKASPFKTVIDVTDLVHKAAEIFQEDLANSPMPYKYSNSLEKLTLEMEDLRLRSSNHKVKIVRNIGKAESLVFFEQMFLATANWYARLPDFTSLDLRVKLEILKSTWMLWIRLNKLAETAQNQRIKEMGANIFMCSENTCLNVQDINVDWSWCTNYGAEQMQAFLMPNIDKHWRQPVEDLVKLNPTDMELNFMLIQLCLNDAGKKFQGRVLEATDKLLQINADNLHNYYTKKLNMPSYSGRLTKLMKINQIVEEDVRERKEKAKIVEVFDLFSIVYSHPEMFEGT
ncbi:Nuclear Hormone Receptor family [Caenorhabditis elegans]|uniref:Nuclear Hormone Receptor family n=1 Tax=Caenorhabditis elegans TaxID=6239 RepID=H2L019_CAEEL|nr:Nuclear Hormone Receptor family [Caenorhabditis elegans]CCD71011.1 Nuclear Hormone Receptor family [Caenorhabditis elegans]|eukprot:NP_001023926.1 Nuclear Hormone Receptor family [Caenorhabditis elegans]